MSAEYWDAIWVNGQIATCANGYGLIKNGAVAVKNGKIAWIGPETALDKQAAAHARVTYDMRGQCMTPGLVDCHTHLVYAGNRAVEFEQRLQGLSYAEITKRGGGIQSTVAATRAASEEMLLHKTLERARVLQSGGVTTLEIKSGYGLDQDTELKILRVAQRVTEYLPLTIKKTFLGAHVVPPEYHGRVDDYVDWLCDDMIPRIAKEHLADAVDVFCEHIAFNLQQTERIFACAKQHQLATKCHAEQLSDIGAARLAAQYGALSVDHLEYASETTIQYVAQTGTTAVLLPGAFYFLRETQLPPLSQLREYHVPIAIATDCNPGTSPLLSLLLVMNMACVLFRMTPEEALLGVTQHAARALGLAETHGTLIVGKVADFALWEVEHPAELAYTIGLNPLYQLVKSGEVIL